MTVTIDASVFVAAARVEEAHYSTSRSFLTQVRQQDVATFCPVLILPEVGAAIARRTDNPSLATNLTALIEHFPGLQLIPLTLLTIKTATQIAITHKLRGADAVYAAVAFHFETTLVTWDQEMLERSASVVRSVTPQVWLENNVIVG